MILSALALSAAVATQATPSTARWEITPDAMLCQLRSANRPTAEQNVIFEVTPLSQEVDMVVVGGPKLPKAKQQATIRSSSWPASISATYHPATDTDLSGPKIRISASDFQRLAETKIVEVTVGEGQPLQVNVEGLKAGVVALDQCTSKILSRIGYVPNEPTPVPPDGFVKNPPKYWITTEDFTRADMIKGGSGKALIGWIIGRDGRVRNCTTLTSVGNEILGVESCKLLTKRALYTPQKDSSGATVERFSYRWMVFRP